MMCPGPRSAQASRSRFQCTTCQPPVPSPSSTAVVLTTTRSPRATVPVSCVSTYARSGPWPRSTSTRCNPGRSTSSRVTFPERNEGTIARLGSESAARAEAALQRRDQALDAVVAGLEGVLAQHGALSLVVQLQVDPVDGVVALAFLGALDERAPEAGSCRLRRAGHCDVDVAVANGPLQFPASLEQVVEGPRARDVVVGEVEQRDPRMGQWKI